MAIADGGVLMNGNLASGFDENVIIADSDSDSGVNSEQRNIHINGTPSPEFDTIELSSGSSARKEEYDRLQVCGNHLSGTRSSILIPSQQSPGFSNYCRSDILSLDSTHQDSKLSAELLRKYHKVKTKEPTRPTEDIDGGFLFGQPTRLKSILQGSSEGDSMLIRKKDFLSRLWEPRSAKLGNADSKKKRETNEEPRSAKTRELNGRVITAKDAIAQSPPEPAVSMEKDAGEKAPRGFLAPETERRGLRHESPPVPISKPEAIRNAAEPINGISIDAEDTKATAAFKNAFERQERKAQKKATRFLGFGVQPNSDGATGGTFKSQHGLTNGYCQQQIQQDKPAKPDLPSTSVQVETGHLEIIPSKHSALKSASTTTNHAKDDEPKAPSLYHALYPEPTGPIPPNHDILRTLKDERTQVINHLSDLRSIQYFVEETARYRYVRLDDRYDRNIRGELDEIREFASAVLRGKVYTRRQRKRFRDIKDNMIRRRRAVAPGVSEEDLQSFTFETPGRKFLDHAAFALDENTCVQIFGAISLAVERRKQLTSLIENQQKRSHHKKQPGIEKPNRPSSIERLGQLRSVSQTTKKAENLSLPASADQVIDFDDISASDVEVSSDEDEAPEEFEARKRRALKARHQEKYKVRAAAHNTSIISGKEKDFEDLRHADLEAQEFSQGSFNAATELPPGFDRNRVFHQHRRHFDERGALPAGILTGQGRIFSPATEASKSDDETVATVPDADIIVDSDSDSSVIDIAEECYEYIVKGQKSSIDASSSPAEHEHTYGSHIDLPSAHSRISHLLGRLPFTTADVRRGARIVSDLSSGELNLLEQTIIFFNTGKTLRFWIEKRRVYAEGTVKKRTFAQRRVYQVNESHTVTTPGGPSATFGCADGEDLFTSPPPLPQPASNTNTKSHNRLYFSLPDANDAALEIFLSSCAACCDAPDSFWDRQRTLCRSKLTDLATGPGDDDDLAAAFNERKVFREMTTTNVTAKRVEIGGEDVGWAEIRTERRAGGFKRMEEVRVWVAGVEVVGPRN